MATAILFYKRMTSGLWALGLIMFVFTAAAETPLRYIDAAEIGLSLRDQPYLEAAITDWVPPSNKLTYEIKFEFTEITKDVQVVFVSGASGSWKDLVDLRLDGGKLRIDYGTQYSAGTYEPKVGEVLTCRIETNKLYLVDGEQKTLIQSRNDEDFTLKGKFVIGARPTGSGKWLNPTWGSLASQSHIKLYYLRIRNEDGTLFREYLPCVQDKGVENGGLAVGLHETVTGAILYSANAPFSPAERTTWRVYPHEVDGLTGAQQLTNAVTQLLANDTVLIEPGAYDLTGLYMYVKPITNSAITNHLQRFGVPFTLAGNTSGHWDDSVVITGDRRFLDNYYSGVRAGLLTVRNLTLDGFYGGYSASPGSSSASRGGALSFAPYSGSSAVSTATNCILRNCTAQIGGAIQGGIVNDCFLTNNVSTYASGGAAVNTRFLNCRVVGNRAQSYYSGSYGHYGVWNSTFVANSHSQSGVLSNNADYPISNCTFVANESRSTGTGVGGGAIYCAVADGQPILDCRFIGNTSGKHGGAIFGNFTTSSVSVVVRDCVFSNNFAQGWGGAVYALTNGAYGVRGFRMEKCEFVGNLAALRAGGVAGVIADHCKFIGNYNATADGESVTIGSSVGGSAAVWSHLTDCDFDTAEFLGCSLTRCTVHDASDPRNHVMFLDLNYLTNCLVTGGTCESGKGFFYWYSNNPARTGECVNCTFAANTNIVTWVKCRNKGLAGMRFVNCIFKGNLRLATDTDFTDHPYQGNVTGGVSYKNCIFGTSGTGSAVTGWWDDLGGNQFSTNPRFVAGMAEKLGVPYYSIGGSSPAKGKAAPIDWPAGATDLAGNPRVREDGTLDIGCYQNTVAPFGLLMIVR